MLLAPSNSTHVYLAPGFTDMRKSINGLSIFVEESMELFPFSSHLFAFCNRRRTIIKILYWDRNGFCLWQKRLEKHVFKWPETEKEVLQITAVQLCWLLEGLDMRQKSEHTPLTYQTLI